MRLRIYEGPTWQADECSGRMEWEAPYDEYLAETAEKARSGTEVFDWKSWSDVIAGRPFGWVREIQGAEIFIGKFYFRKTAVKAMADFIKAKYPEAEFVEFLNEGDHFKRMYGG